MSTSRALVAVVAALSAALPSFDPAVRPHEHAPRAVLPAITAVHEALPPRSPEAALDAASAPAPADLRIEIVPEGGLKRRVEVHRPGYLVALLHGAARSAGRDWAGMRVEPGKGKGDAAERLVWETTPLDGMTTTRGLVSLRLVGAELRAEVSSAPAPEGAGEWTGAHHTCAAHRDGAGGFVVLCRLHHGATRVAAANVTGPRSLEGAAVMAGKSPLVRLDLPLAPGMAEARVIGFTAGRAGVVLRADASWAEGEPPVLVIDEAERAQPVAP